MAWMCGRPVQIAGDFDRMQDAQRASRDWRPYLASRFNVRDVWAAPDRTHDQVWLDYQSTMRLIERSK